MFFSQDFRERKTSVKYRTKYKLQFDAFCHLVLVSFLAKISSSVVLFEALFWAQMNESLSLKVTASFTNENRFSHSWFPIYQFAICTSSFFPGMFWIVSPTMNIGLNSSSTFSTIAVVVDQLVGQLFSGSTSFRQQLMIWRFIDHNVSIGYADINQEPKQISPPFSRSTGSGIQSTCLIALVDTIHVFVVQSNNQGGRYVLLAVFLLSLHSCGAGAVGSVLDETRQTGFLFLVSCQIVAMIGPSPVIFCHCLNSPGLSFSFGTTGSPLLGFLFAISTGRFFTFRFTVPQPKSFHLSNSWCK